MAQQKTIIPRHLVKYIMKLLADFHLHSRFSRATSQKLTVGNIAATCKQKGVDLIGSGDCLHPIWLRELKENLVEQEPGLYIFPQIPEIRFTLSVEISLIYSQDQRTHRNHIVLLMPSFEVAKTLQRKLQAIGNLASDGRPILGMKSSEFVARVLDVDPKILVISAHIWTPWFSLFGSKSGFDHFVDCYGEMSQYVKTVETGLSADPLMCWRVKDLEEKNIISSGDAHSPAKIGREGTILEIEKWSYENIYQALTDPPSSNDGIETGPRVRLNPKRDAHLGASLPANRITGTIEFFPEEGKYHWNGHRACGVVQSAATTKKLGTKCPVCGRELTLGVKWRVEELANRSEKDLQIERKDGWLYSKTNPDRPPYRRLVPLDEIIAETVGVKSAASNKVLDLYQKITQIWSERQVLLEVPIKEIEKQVDPRLAEAIDRVRREDLEIDPGYDNTYGRINIWRPGENPNRTADQNQMGLFSD